MTHLLRRVMALMLTLALALTALTACDSKQDNEEISPTTPEITSQNGGGDSTTATEATSPSEQETAALIDLSNLAEEKLDDIIVSQGNRHGLNAFVYDGNWIYGAWGGYEGAGEVVKVRYDNSDWTLIDSDTNGRIGLCYGIKNGYLYYAQENDTSYEIIKVRASGEEPKTIIKDANMSAQIVDNYIYYTTKEAWLEDDSGVTQESSHLYRCDLNGEKEELIIEKPVYYFTVFNDKILYQDDKDNCSLHLFDMTTKEDNAINDSPSYWPIYDGEFVYYLSPETFDAKGYELYKIHLDGTNKGKIDVGSLMVGLLLRGDYIYYINFDDNNRIYRCLKNGSGVELVTQDSDIMAMQWVNDYLAYTCTDEDGYITGTYICDFNGGDRIEFCESDDYWYLN